MGGMGVTKNVWSLNICEAQIYIINRKQTEKITLSRGGVCVGVVSKVGGLYPPIGAGCKISLHGTGTVLLGNWAVIHWKKDSYFCGEKSGRFTCKAGSATAFFWQLVANVRETNVNLPLPQKFVTLLMKKMHSTEPPATFKDWQAVPCVTDMPQICQMWYICDLRSHAHTVVPSVLPCLKIIGFPGFP